MSDATITTNHRVIRSWAEARRGRPSRLRDSAEGGVLRIDFEPTKESRDDIGWDAFFAVFEGCKLAFVHQDLTEDGAVSRFNKFVVRKDA